MATIVINPAGDILGHGDKAERVDAQGEVGLIKVDVGTGFYYIGTSDRDTYTFVDGVTLPANFDPSLDQYVNGAFVLKA